ncbi:ATP-binding protein [Polyangium fumosum]|uniref:histidine kinase n=1 Tax=Polyangium fumosum TaxID=889272 RepID=A0A4U1JFZ6_9BACT|nr:ATP-binding protein [Polyangium fumosum]
MPARGSCLRATSLRPPSSLRAVETRTPTRALPAHRVRVVDDDGETIVAAVRDTGADMSAELLVRVFEPFVQGAQSMERSADGLGIGLTLVKSLVSLHDGEVSANSDSLGHGSRIEPTPRCSRRARCTSPRS